MIISIDESPKLYEGKLAGFTLVDGSFDPLHDGHIDYFEQAHKLGNPVACLIAPENYTSKKHSIFLEKVARAKLIDSIKYISLVVLTEISTEDSILLLKPSVFFKGGDWKGRIPQGISETCRSIDCDLVFGRKPINSSSELLERYKSGQEPE